MDRDTCVARIQEKLGFRSDLQQNIINALQDAQDEMEKGDTLPWFLLKEDQPFVITPPNPAVATPLEVALPAGFIKESDAQDGNLRYQAVVPGPYIYLDKLDLTEAETFFFSRTKPEWELQFEVIPQEDLNFVPGVPMAYVLRANTVRIYPGPDIQYTLTWSYYAHDQRLDGANLTNGWTTNAPWLLIGHAGLLTAQNLRDADAVAIFEYILYGDATRGTKGAEKDFLALLYEREIAGRSFHMGARL